jgi:hemoglobin/transferrin/lactoferrin receptor protein
MSVKPACASLAIAFALAASSAHAQDADGLWWVERTNRITVTATRSEKPIIDVPATVTVITAEQIDDNMVEDIKDLVRFEPGVSVKRAPSRFSNTGSGNDARAGNTGFNIRGLDGNRVLIQIDGIRVPDAYSFGGQSAGRGDYVDLGLLKSVEILRGPASALYGSDGLAGAVSFVTADPSDVLGKDRSFGGSVRASYDSADRQYSESAMLAARSGDWSILAAYTRRDGKELDNKGTIETSNASRTAPNPQDTASNAAMGKIVWSPHDHTRVRLTVDHVDDRVDSEVLTANGGTVNITIPASMATIETRSGTVPRPVSGRVANTILTTNTHDTTKRDRISLDWTQKALGPIDEMHLTAYWQKSRSRQSGVEELSVLTTNRERVNIFDNRTVGLSADFQSGFATGAIEHKLIWGGDWSATRQEGIREGVWAPAGETFPTRAFPITDYALFGGFLADEISIADGAFTLFPVLRFDHYSLDAKADPAIPSLTAIDKSGSHVSPKIGAVAKLSDNVRFFANYARGFKAPAPSQVNQFFENPTGRYRTIPNADLKPETSETFEGGVRLTSENVSLNITGFTGSYRNFISLENVGFASDGFMLFQNVNLGKVKISGAEAQFEARSRSGLYANLALSYARGTVNPGLATESGLLSIDPAKLVMGLGYRDPKGLFGGQLIMTHSAGKSLGSVRGADTAVSACSAAADCIRPEAFTILDATAFVKLGEHLTLRAGLFNLLDTKYSWWSDIRPLAATAANLAIVDSYTQPGRNVSVSLTAKF